MPTNEEIQHAIERLAAMHMVTSVRDYVFDGLPPGDFLEAVMKNDLFEACAKADEVNARLIGNYGKLLTQIPRGAWGSKKSVNSWIAIGGLNGILSQSKEKD